MTLPTTSANELRKAGKGKTLSKIWYPAGEFFSFFELYFDARKNASPEVKGAWILGQEDIRRYVFSLTDFYALQSEIEYVVSTPGSSAELSFDDVYETRCLRSLQNWEAPFQILLSSTESEIRIEFSGPALASASYTSVRPKLLAEYTSSIFKKWCTSIVAFRLKDYWFLPLGGSYSVFDDNEQELAILSAEDVFSLQQDFEEWDGEPKELRFGSLSLKLNEADATLTILDVVWDLTFREIEALLNFLLSRLFLSEGGSFALWRDNFVKSYRNKGTK